MPEADLPTATVPRLLLAHADVEAAVSRLDSAELLAEAQQEEVCCFARQNKAISYDPQGLMWEWYRVLEDSPTFFEQPGASGACCAETAEPDVAAGGCC